MQKTWILTTTAIALVLAVGTAAVADARGGMDRMGNRGGHGGLDFASLDTDGDGFVTVDEIEGRGAARFAEIDADGDGQISRQEFLDHATAQFAARAGAQFDRLDADGDGFLSQDAIMARGGRGPDPVRMIERFDADGDGAVSAAEFEAALAEMSEHRPGRGRHMGGDHDGPRFRN